MARKGGLGKGLDALIPGDSSAPVREEIYQLDTNSIDPNPLQPRTEMNEEVLQELASSIREFGILQPLIVTTSQLSGRYTLIAGERRLRAAKIVGLETVPAIVRGASEQERLELALIENVQRADLSPLETAEAYRQLADDFSLSHEEIADRVGKSRVAVSNTLRLLKLPPVVRQALAQGRISEGHARALLGLNSSQAMAAALQSILDRELNVRQTEELVRRLMGERPERSPRPTPPPEVVDLEQRLRESLGTRVTVRQHRKGGQVIIHYYSNEELDSIIEQILRD